MNHWQEGQRGQRKSGGGHRPKKSLGQNFLTSEGVINSMVSVAELHDESVVLEIGPGKGALTKGILRSPAKRVIAIETDPALVLYLSDTFPAPIGAGRLVLVADDVLNTDPRDHLAADEEYCIVANIPYNITGAILRHFLTQPQQPTHMVILMQREVAERIVCRDHKHSLLSQSVQVYGQSKIVQRVAPGSFFPAPRVESAVLLIENISRQAFTSTDHEANFFRLIKAGFAHKRKTLGNNLGQLFDRTKLSDILGSIGLGTNTRAEDVSTEQWLAMAEHLDN